MNSKIILSADSTCDLNDELKEKYQVHYYPYHIILDEKDYLDNVTIFPDDIYQAYYDKKILPKTAAINAAEYTDYFKGWVQEGYDVIHLNLGSALSSSYQNCCIAAEELGHVYPVNSCNLSTGIGLLVIEAAQRIAGGFSAADISRQLQAMTSCVHSSFILDTLTFMHAGGRCSAVTALGANLLNLKPCIEVNNKDGSMSVRKKYRGTLEKVLVNYTRTKLNEYQNIRKEQIFITHSGIDQNYIDLVKNTIEETFHFDHIYVTRASCTISCHCGPNTLGILFLTNQE